MLTFRPSSHFLTPQKTWLGVDWHALVSGAQNIGQSNHKLTSALKCTVWLQCTPVPDRQTNIIAIARRFILWVYCTLKWWVRPVWCWMLWSVTIWNHWIWKGYAICPCGLQSCKNRPMSISLLDVTKKAGKPWFCSVFILATASFFCLSFVFLVYVVLCFFVFGLSVPVQLIAWKDSFLKWPIMYQVGR